MNSKQSHSSFLATTTIKPVPMRAQPNGYHLNLSAHHATSATQYNNTNSLQSLLQKFHKIKSLKNTSYSPCLTKSQKTEDDDSLQPSQILNLQQAQKFKNQYQDHLVTKIQTSKDLINLQALNQNQQNDFDEKRLKQLALLYYTQAKDQNSSPTFSNTLTNFTQTPFSQTDSAVKFSDDISNTQGLTQNSNQNQVQQNALKSLMSHQKQQNTNIPVNQVSGPIASIQKLGGMDSKTSSVTDLKNAEQSQMVRNILQQAVSMNRAREDSLQSIISTDMQLQNNNLIQQQLQIQKQIINDKEYLLQQQLCNQNSAIEIDSNLKLSIQNDIRDIKIMKLSGLQSDEFKNQLAIKTQQLNYKMKLLIEHQKNVQNPTVNHVNTNQKGDQILRQYLEQQKAAADQLEREHQEKLLQTMLEIQKISNYKQSCLDQTKLLEGQNDIKELEGSCDSSKSLSARIIEQIQKETELTNGSNLFAQAINPSMNQNEMNQTYLKDLLNQISLINKPANSDYDHSVNENQLPNGSDMSLDQQLDSKDDSLDKKSEPQSAVNSNQRKRREIFKCPHTDKKHYAKNMCHNCYHRKGKTKMAHACGHPHKSHYSSGMCQNCYLAKYYIKRKVKQAEKSKAKEESTDDLAKLGRKDTSDVSEQNTEEDIQTGSKKQRLD